MNKRAFSLLELMVVLVIVGILSILALPPFRAARENALVKEAQANLKLIQAAEKIYGLEATYYRAAGSTAAVNSSLLLDIPSTNNWAYTVDTVTATNFRARAARQPDGTPIWCMRRDDTQPESNTSAPAWCN